MELVEQHGGDARERGIVELILGEESIEAAEGPVVGELDAFDDLNRNLTKDTGEPGIATGHPGSALPLRSMA